MLPQNRERILSVYIIAQLKFTERERYERYQSRFFGVFRNFRGKLLVAGEHPGALGGEWPRGKGDILGFPDAEAAREFEESPEYREIAVDRKAGAVAVVLTVRGLK